MAVIGVTGWLGDGGNIRFIRLIRAQFQHSLRKLLINWQARLLSPAPSLFHSVSHAVACAFLFALRTGVRAGELCSLPLSKVYPDYVTVSGKNGTRNVAITYQANRILNQLRGWDETLVAGIQPQTLDAMFRKYRNKARLSGFTFHDTRHTAATRIAQKIQVLDLCRLFGWRNPVQALVYYNPTASDIAKRLQR